MANSNRDFDFFFNGLEEGKLLIQRCRACSTSRAFPAPMCPNCQSLEFDQIALSGRGRIYSYTIHHHPPLPDFPTPHAIVLAVMDEGVRILASLAGVMPDQVRIGMAIDTEFVRRGDCASFRFIPGREAALPNSGTEQR